MQNATKALLLVCAFSVSMAQVSEKSKFGVRVLRVSRTGKIGCTAQVDSAKVRYTISSDTAGPCAMLRAGEDYRAFLVTGRPPGNKNDAQDTAEIVIENNRANPERKNAVFEIDGQEVRDSKSK